MKTRIIIGSSILLAIAVFFVLDHVFETRVLVSSLILFFGLAAWLEVARLGKLYSRAEGGGVSLFLVGLAGTGYFLSLAWWESVQGANAVPAGGTIGLDRNFLATGLAVLLFVSFLAVLFRREHEKVLRALCATLLGVLLFGFLFSYTLRIYHQPEGSRLALFFLLGVKGNDIAAYFVGSALGRHTFLKVSPKKTLEGCSAAVIFSMLWFVGGSLLWFDSFFHWPQAILLGIIFSVTTQAGDLAESLMKRSYGVKDSAALIPEFGGVLDLIDSTLFSGFLFWSLI